MRPQPREDTDLVLRVLSERSQCLVASPALLEQVSSPAVPADLASLPSMDLGVPRNEHVWQQFGPDGARADIRHNPRLITRGMLALRTAAVAGVGIVQMPKMMVCDQLQAGELVHVLSEWAPRRELIRVVFPSRHGLLPAIHGLIDFLAERFQEIDED